MPTALVASRIVYKLPGAASSVRKLSLLSIVVFSSALCRYSSPVDDSGAQEYLYRARSRRQVIIDRSFDIWPSLLSRPKPNQFPRISPS